MWEFASGCKVDIGCWISAAWGISINTLAKVFIKCAPSDTKCINDLRSAAERVAFDPNPDPQLIADVANSGAIFQLAALNGSLTSMDIPVSTQIFLANSNPFKQVSASGYSDLQNANKIYEIWRNARNAAFAISIVVLVVLGFMIMFRAKIDPRTSVSLTNSLPKIIIMLLLITFSFAMGGLILDIARILTKVLLNVVGLGGSDAVRFFLATILLIIIPAVAGVLIVGVPGLVLGALLLLVILIYIFIVEILIVFHMIVRYAQFLVGLIFGPLVLLLYPLPGGSDYVKSWLRKEVAFILTIPITLVIVAVAFKVGGSCIPSPFGSGIIGAIASVCGATGTPELGFLGLTSFISPFIGLGILSLATKAPQIADDIMGVKPLGGPKGGFTVGGMIGAPSHALKNVYDIQRGAKSIREIGSSYGPIASRLMGGSPIGRSLLGRFRGPVAPPPAPARGAAAPTPPAAGYAAFGAMPPATAGPGWTPAGMPAGPGPMGPTGTPGPTGPVGPVGPTGAPGAPAPGVTPPAVTGTGPTTPPAGGPLPPRRGPRGRRGGSGTP